MPLRWASCLFRPAKGAATSLELNSSACPAELQEQLASRGTACLRPRGSQVIYERIDDAGQGAFTPPVVIYIKRLPVCGGLDVCIKRTLVTHFVGRAAREARLQVQLHHPHLLPALASVRGRHHYYLVLPAADGDLWAEVEALKRQGTGYREGELREVARQILLGLEHLHASGLAHRDIKPANVLRLPDGRVAVADFGCADGCTAGFVAAGTTQFQPPECRRNAGAQLAVLPKGYDQRLQDMWSLGATLTALWFGSLPEVIRGKGSSRISSAAVAASAVADAAAAAAAAAAPGGEQVGNSAGSDGAECSPGVDIPATTVTAAAPLPRCLALAGFAACTCTTGACGAPMSGPLLDLLGGLLRLRPSERLTASQALQHEWLAAGDGCRSACRAAASVSAVELAMPAAALQAVRVESGEVESTATSLPPSPTGRERAGGGGGGGRLMPFASHQQLRYCGGEGASMTTALGAHAAPPPPPPPPAAAEDGSDGSTEPSSSPHHWHHPHQHPPLRSSPSGSADTPSTLPATPSRPSTPPPPPPHHHHHHQQQQQYGAPGHTGRCSWGRTADGLGALGDSPGTLSSTASLSPGEQAQQLALRQQQQQQQQQRGQSSSSSTSSWLLRPLSHAPNPKHAQRAILRVFVGAGGESSGSN